MVGTFVLSLILLGLSGFLLDTHRRSWRAAEQDASLAPSERRYALSQYRRRMQASGIIGVLGVAIGCRSMVPHDPVWLMLYLVSLLGASLAITVLAGMDAWATRQHFARLRSENLATQTKLVRELQGKATAANDSLESTGNYPTAPPEDLSSQVASRCLRK